MIEIAVEWRGGKTISKFEVPSSILQSDWSSGEQVGNLIESLKKNYPSGSLLFKL